MGGKREPMGLCHSHQGMSSSGFRFQNMDIWLRAAKVSTPLFKLAATLNEQRLYRFGEQLRAAVLSITNNIAEGSGSASDAEFANFLNISRRSVYEVANMLIMLSRDGYLRTEEVAGLLAELEEQSRMILAFRRTLKA